MKNKSIAFFMPNLNHGGGNRVLISLQNFLNDKRIYSELYYVNQQHKNFAYNLKNTHFISSASKNLSLFLFSTLLLSLKLRLKSKSEFVIISDPIACIFSIIFLNKKVIRYVQSDDYLLFDFNKRSNLIINFLYKHLFKLSQNYKYHCVLFNSQYSLDAYNKNLKPSKRLDNKHIINPGVFTNNFNSNINIRKKDFKIIKICIFTRKHKRKGYDDFLEIANKTKFKNIIFSVISQDNFYDKYKNIHYFKPVNDEEIVNILKKNHFILNTSSFEGFGLPLLEGMALGLVPLSCFNYGLNEYNIDNCIKIFNNVNEFDCLIDEFLILKNFSFYSNKAKAVASLFTEKRFCELFIKKINI